MCKQCWSLIAVSGTGCFSQVPALQTSPGSLLHCCQGSLFCVTHVGTVFGGNRNIHLLTFTTWVWLKRWGFFFCNDTQKMMHSNDFMHMTPFIEMRSFYCIYIWGWSVTKTYVCSITGLSAGCGGDRCFPTHLRLVARHLLFSKIHSFTL